MQSQSRTYEKATPVRLECDELVVFKTKTLDYLAKPGDFRDVFGNIEEQRLLDAARMTGLASKLHERVLPCKKGAIDFRSRKSNL